MTGVELIVAALAAATTAGITNGVQDAYASLKGLLMRRLADREQAIAALEAGETSPGQWQARIGADLAGSGAASDIEVLAAARAVLAAADPAQAQAGIYTVMYNHGAVGLFHGPVTFNQGPPDPPATPGTI
ncbi:hypothetical protein AB0E12_13370 [Micromonospora chersina]|uniref:hypothetical protein n=1 Tax=Micromonospora chersina TaxID=47854 RepID=UPI0033CEEEA8